jgi:hypothetical protein
MIPTVIGVIPNARVGYFSGAQLGTISSGTMTSDTSVEVGEKNMFERMSLGDNSTLGIGALSSVGAQATQNSYVMSWGNSMIQALRAVMIHTAGYLFAANAPTVSPTDYLTPFMPIFGDAFGLIVHDGVMEADSMTPPVDREIVSAFTGDGIMSTAFTSEFLSTRRSQVDLELSIEMLSKYSQYVWCYNPWPIQPAQSSGLFGGGWGSFCQVQSWGLQAGQLMAIQVTWVRRLLGPTVLLSEGQYISNRVWFVDWKMLSGSPATFSDPGAGQPTDLRCSWPFHSFYPVWLQAGLTAFVILSSEIANMSAFPARSTVHIAYSRGTRKTNVVALPVPSLRSITSKPPSVRSYIPGVAGVTATMATYYGVGSQALSPGTRIDSSVGLGKSE